MVKMNELHDKFKSEIKDLKQATKYKLIKSNIKNIDSTDRGIYGLYHKDKLIYIGQAGGNINTNNKSTHLLKERLYQYTREGDTGTKNLKEYLEFHTLNYSDIYFNYITVEDCRIIKILELVMIDYFSKNNKLRNK